jgi:hypothetical protein
MEVIVDYCITKNSVLETPNYIPYNTINFLANLN